MELNSQSIHHRPWQIHGSWIGGINPGKSFSALLFRFTRQLSTIKLCLLLLMAANKSDPYHFTAEKISTNIFSKLTFRSKSASPPGSSRELRPTLVASGWSKKLSTGHLKICIRIGWPRRPHRPLVPNPTLGDWKELPCGLLRGHHRNLWSFERITKNFASSSIPPSSDLILKVHYELNSA